MCSQKESMNIKIRLYKGDEIMGVFNSSKTISTKLRNLKPVLSDVKTYFEDKGYTVQTGEVDVGGFISITKGGFFKSVAGLKTALNTTLTFQQGSIFVEAKVGAFGEQAMAAAAGWIVTWPLAITSAIGMISQSKLDEEMINEIEKSIYKYEQRQESSSTEEKFCVDCGAPVPADAAFCPNCGKKQ